MNVITNLVVLFLLLSVLWETHFDPRSKLFVALVMTLGLVYAYSHRPKG